MTQVSTRRRPQGPTGSTRRIAGFTLIELMIAVAVIGILASIAIPSYRGYVERARVTDGQAGLMQAAQEMERCYTVSSIYKRSCQVTQISPDGIYTIELVDSAGNGWGSDQEESYFILMAKNPSKAVTPDCESLWVKSNGTKGSGASVGSGAGDANDCW